MFTNIFEYIAVSRRLEFQWLWYSAPSSCGPRRTASPVQKSGRPGWCTATDLCALQVALYIKNWRPAQRREHAAPVLIRAGLVGAVGLRGSEAPTAWPRPSPCACEASPLWASGQFSRPCPCPRALVPPQRLSFSVHLEFRSVLRSSAYILPTCVFPDSSTSCSPRTTPLLCVCAFLPQNLFILLCRVAELQISLPDVLW